MTRADKRIYLSVLIYFSVAFALVIAEVWFAISVFRGDHGNIAWVFLLFAMYWAWRTWAAPRLRVPTWGHR